MNPKNFPGRKARRQERAEMPKGAKTEPKIDPEVRNIRTKKRRTKKA